MSENIIIDKVKVTFVFTGYGYITLTDKALVWNKSATSYLAFGAANALTVSHLYLPISDISEVGTYTYFPGGGLLLKDRELKVYKFSFKHKKEFKLVYEYLRKRVQG